MSQENIAILSVKPTQFCYGESGVNAKYNKIANSTEQERDTYVSSHPLPVVAGPLGKLYLIDRHHLALAMLKFGISFAKTTLIEDLSAMSEFSFWETMKEKGFVYLKDKDDIDRTPQDLPQSLLELQNSIYRSLAYDVREMGGYRKVWVPFNEFKWASFFRTHIPEIDNYKEMLDAALLLSLGTRASHLPGYIGK